MFQASVTHTLLQASLTRLNNHRGGVEHNSQSSTYGDNPVSAALEKGAAFSVCANPKNSIAMINNNFNELGTYVSPAVKVTQIQTRRVMCTSPGFGDPGQAGHVGFYDDANEDERM